MLLTAVIIASVTALLAAKALKDRQPIPVKTEKK